MKQTSLSFLLFVPQHLAFDFVASINTAMQMLPVHAPQNKLLRNLISPGKTKGLGDDIILGNNLFNCLNEIISFFLMY